MKMKVLKKFRKPLTRSDEISGNLTLVPMVSYYFGGSAIPIQRAH